MRYEWKDVVGSEYDALDNQKEAIVESLSGITSDSMFGWNYDAQTTSLTITVMRGGKMKPISRAGVLSKNNQRFLENYFDEIQKRLDLFRLTEGD